MTTHCKTDKYQSISPLVMTLFLLFTLSLARIYAQDKITYIDPPKISLGIDTDNERPINIRSKIPQNIDKIYTSSFSHNAFADDKVLIKWYLYKDEKPILIKKQTVDATGYEFINSSLKSKQRSFPLGYYKVAFQIGLGVPKVVYFDVVPAKHSKSWHYNATEFKGWSDSKKRGVKIIDVTIQQINWNNKEKKVALVVKTDLKTLKDDFIFCQKEKGYYYCPIEGDAGYIKMDKDMNIQLKVDFTKDAEEGMVSELSIVQKQKNRWVHPITTKERIQKDCSTFSKQAYKAIFSKVLKRYPKFTTDDIKKYKPKRYYDPKHRVSLVVPNGWNSITKYDDNILYLRKVKDGATSKFMLKSLSKFWDNTDTKEPEKIIQKAAKVIAEISTEEAVKNGEKIQTMERLKLSTKRPYTTGHLVLYRTGEKNRWESYAFIWDTKNLYLLAIISPKNDSLSGEFLSSLGMESFCSEATEVKK